MEEARPGEVKAASDRLWLSVEQSVERRLCEVTLAQHQIDQPLRVDPLAAGSPGHLKEVAAAHVVEAHAVELSEAAEGDRARWHVDAEGEGLCGEEEAQEPRGEHLLHELFVEREHARVVIAHTPASEGHDFAGEVLLPEVVLLDELGL